MSAPSLDLKHIREVTAAADNGPWLINGSSDDIGIDIIADNLGGVIAWAAAWPTEIDTGDFLRPLKNATFIASARTWVPALVDRITELEELAARSVRRLVEATAPGSIGAFGARDAMKERADAAEARLAIAEGLLRGVDMAIAYTATGAKWVGLDAGANSDWLKQRDDFLTVKPALSNQKEAAE